jgi:hypothetical protein
MPRKPTQERKTLPKSYSKGAKKAHREFQIDYGETEGRRIFFQKAEEQGVGKTLRQRVNSVFATGARPSERERT